MLMRRMLRLRLLFILAFTALLGTEPIYHNHPLIPDGTAAVQSLCAVCASGADHVTLSAPAVVAPADAAYALELPALKLAASRTPLHLSSRAPPAA